MNVYAKSNYINISYFKYCLFAYHIYSLKKIYKNIRKHA